MEKATLFSTFVVLLFSLFFSACGETPIEQLEAKYAAEENFDDAKQLVTLYREAAKEDKSTNQAFDYFVKAARLQYDVMHDAVSAVRWLDDALEHYGKPSKNTSKAYALYTQVYRDYRYKSAETVRLDLDDIDKMQARLAKNVPLVEAARADLKKEMLIDSTMLLEPTLAERFVDVSEGLALLLERSDVDRAVELNIESGNASRAYGNFQRGIRMYYAVADAYPRHKRAAEALFMAGFTYDNDISDYEAAQKTYTELIDKYPETKYAADARELVKLLGKPLDEVIEQFEGANSTPSK